MTPTDETGDQYEERVFTLLTEQGMWVQPAKALAMELRSMKERIDHTEDEIADLLSQDKAS